MTTNASFRSGKEDVLANAKPLYVGTARLLVWGLLLISEDPPSPALGSLGSEELHFANLPRATCLEATDSQRNEACPVCKYGHLSVAHWLVSSTCPSAILASAILMPFTILA